MHKLLLLSILATAAPAATLVKSTGPIDYGVGLTSTIFAVSFNLAQPFTNVEIWATISGFTQSSHISAFLSNGTGPGTVPVASTSLANPDTNYTDTLLLSNLTLGAGTYFLALHGTNESWANSNTSSTLLSFNSTRGPDYLSNGSFGVLNLSNLSANIFVVDTSGGPLFRVTGDAVPEPSTYALVGVALVGLIASRKRKTNF